MRSFASPRMTASRPSLLILAFFLFPFTFPLSAEPPSPTGYVNDFAGVLDASTTSQLTNILTAFNEQTQNEIAVATVPSLGGEPIENYAVKLYQEWGLGKKGKDNGALILMALNERAVRIEVGYGLEGIINDAMAGRIIRETMIPWFKKGDFSNGLLNGAVEIVTIIAKKENIKFDPTAALGGQKLHSLKSSGPPHLSRLLNLIVIVFLILLFIKNPWAFLLIMSLPRGRFGGGFGGGGLGRGGFGGFGGGLSGGGGASGRW